MPWHFANAADDRDRCSQRLPLFPHPSSSLSLRTARQRARRRTTVTARPPRLVGAPSIPPPLFLLPTQSIALRAERVPLPSPKVCQRIPQAGVIQPNAMDARCTALPVAHCPLSGSACWSNLRSNLHSSENKLFGMNSVERTSSCGHVPISHGDILKKASLNFQGPTTCLRKLEEQIVSGRYSRKKKLIIDLLDNR